VWYVDKSSRSISAYPKRRKQGERKRACQITVLDYRATSFAKRNIKAIRKLLKRAKEEAGFPRTSFGGGLSWSFFGGCRAGWPPDHQPEEYAAIAIYRKHFNVSLRIAEEEYSIRLGKRVDHSNIWWIIQRVPIGHIGRVIELLFEFVLGLFLLTSLSQIRPGSNQPINLLRLIKNGNK